MVLIKQCRNDHPYTQMEPEVVKTWEADAARVRTNGEIGVFRNNHLVERILPWEDFRLGDWVEIVTA